MLGRVVGYGMNFINGVIVLGNIGPSPKKKFPIDSINSLCFIKNAVSNPNIIIGDYTYYDDFRNPEKFEENVLYHYDFYGDKLIIGKFCSIGPGTKFIMNGANHKIKSFANYPFGIFKDGWEVGIPDLKDLPFKGDTVIGNDVWIGYDVMIMPGITIGDGAIIGTKSLVTKDVLPYSVVGGNPAGFLRKRFDDEVINLLLKVQWWNWDIEKITKTIPILCSDNADELKKLS